MRKIVFIFILLISFIFSSSRTALASCIPATLEKYKEQADIIALGRVTRISDTSATIVVERYFKGHGGPSQIQVRGRESDSAITSVDFSFQEGKRYLLFLRIAQGTLKTNACMGNREVTANLTDEEIKVLDAGESTNGTSQNVTLSNESEVNNDTFIKNTAMILIGSIIVVGGLFLGLKKLRRI